MTPESKTTPTEKTSLNPKLQFQTRRDTAIQIIKGEPVALYPLGFPTPKTVLFNYYLLFDEEIELLNRRYGLNGGEIYSRQEVAEMEQVSVFTLQQREEAVIRKLLTENNRTLEIQKKKLLAKQKQAVVAILRNEEIPVLPKGAPNPETVRKRFSKLKPHKRDALTLIHGLDGSKPRKLKEAAEMMKPRIKVPALSMIQKTAFEEILGIRYLPGPWRKEEFWELKKVVLEAFRSGDLSDLPSGIPSFEVISQRMEELYDVEQDIFTRRISGQSQARIALDLNTSQAIISAKEYEIFAFLLNPSNSGPACHSLTEMELRDSIRDQDGKKSLR